MNNNQTNAVYTYPQCNHCHCCHHCHSCCNPHRDWYGPRIGPVMGGTTATANGTTSINTNANGYGLNTHTAF